MGGHSAKPVHVLAFGDSLTEGFYQYGRLFHPYAQRLGERLGPTHRVLQFGVSGERAADMGPRLGDLLRRFAPVRVAVILAGTNDMAERPAADALFGVLRGLYEQAFAAGVPAVVAVTIPESSFKDAWYLELRGGVNERIRAYAAANAARMALVDLERELPYDAADKQLWDDHLHMGPKGYDRFGDLVYEAIRAMDSNT